jgi:hypothetical protein
VKLLRCKACADVLQLRRKRRSCECGASAGEYLRDNLRVSVDGPCDVLAGSNKAFENLGPEHQSAVVYIVLEPSAKVLR